MGDRRTSRVAPESTAGLFVGNRGWKRRSVVAVLPQISDKICSIQRVFDACDPHCGAG